MSNLNLKDWRNRALWLASAEKARQRERTITERAMVVATVLSALATCFAGAMTVLQYRTAYDQLVAADRNRAFAEMMDVIDPLCEAYNAVYLNLTVDIARKQVEEKVDRSQATSRVLKSGRSRFVEIGDLTRKARVKLRAFYVWSKPSEQAGLSNIVSNLLSPMELLGVNFIGDMGLSDIVGNDLKPNLNTDWEPVLNELSLVCTDGRDQIVRWFRNGEHLNLRKTGVELGIDREMLNKVIPN